MLDAHKNNLKVGDHVVYVYDVQTHAKIGIGQVKKIYENHCACTINEHTHVFSDRILKLDNILAERNTKTK